LLLEVQLSATFRIEVTDSVLLVLAVAAAPAPAAVEFPEAALASPELALPGAFASGLFVAEAEAFAPALPVSSTCLFTFALNCDSSPCT
jgi:hypothetical protein